jgi:hypothetical protein
MSRATVTGTTRHGRGELVQVKALFGLTTENAPSAGTEAEQQ